MSTTKMTEVTLLRVELTDRPTDPHTGVTSPALPMQADWRAPITPTEVRVLHARPNQPTLTRTDVLALIPGVPQFETLEFVTLRARVFGAVARAYGWGRDAGRRRAALRAARAARGPRRRRARVVCIDRGAR